ncbi:hypothetical protein Dimus_020520, partial [Dionaea muscipula]
KGRLRKARNGGERKCEATTTDVIIISTETSNGRSGERKIEEEEDRRKTRPLLHCSQLVASGKREDLIIVDIDEAYGDDELVCC